MCIILKYVLKIVAIALNGLGFHCFLRTWSICFPLQLGRKPSNLTCLSCWNRHSCEVTHLQLFPHKHRDFISCPDIPSLWCTSRLNAFLKPLSYCVFGTSAVTNKNLISHSWSVTVTSWQARACRVLQRNCLTVGISIHKWQQNTEEVPHQKQRVYTETKWQLIFTKCTIT